MALKGDRHEADTDISHFYNAGTATRGGVVCLDAVNASGAAMDQGANQVKYKQVTAADVVMGILLNDVVNKDLTKERLNEYKDEVQKGGKVTVLTKGWVVTSNITGTPAPGDVAYADDTTAGNVGNASDLGYSSGVLAVGRFGSNKDSDGYAKLHVNLPNLG